MMHTRLALALVAAASVASCHLVAGLDELEIGAGGSGTGGTAAGGAGGAGAGGHGGPSCNGSGASSSIPTDVLPFGDAANQSQPFVATAPKDGGVVVGNYGGTLSLGAGGASGITAGDGDDLFLLRIGTNLDVRFATSIDIDQQLPLAAVDELGHSYVFGTFTGSTELDGGGGAGGSSADKHDIFVAAYDDKGTPLWNITAGGPLDQFGLAIAAAPGGGVYLTGGFQGTLSFAGCAPMASVTDKDIFVVHLDAGGVCHFAQRFGGSGAQFGQALAVDQSGRIWLSGSFSGTLTFKTAPNPIEITTTASSAPYLAALDATGKPLLARSFGVNGQETSGLGRALAIDAAGRVVLVGDFAGALDLGDAEVVTAADPAGYVVGAGDIFVAKYDSAASLLWKQVYGDEASQVARSVAIGPANQVMVSGDFQGCLDFGAASYASRGGEGNASTGDGPLEGGGGDAFVLELDESGGYLRSGAFGGTQSELGRSIALYGGFYLLAGEFEGSAEFAGASLQSQGGKDLFLATFDNGANGG